MTNYSNDNKSASTYSSPSKSSTGIDSFLLLQNGDKVLLQTGDRIIIGNAVDTTTTYTSPTKN